MGKADVNTKTAVFACGCFWSKEYFFRREPGVIRTRVGFTGGHTEHPTYRQVCTKTTGHAEAVEVTYDPEQTNFERLARFFFELHDPTIDRRAKGGQYRSAIFYQNRRQHQIARSLILQLENRGYEVVTQLEPAATFWEADRRHQQYCDVRGQVPHDSRRKRFDLPA